MFIFIRFIECDCYCGGGFGYYLYAPVKIGDFIKIGDVGGEVIEKTALVTRIRAPKFEGITIPNATVLSNTSTTNFSANTKRETNGLLLPYNRYHWIWYHGRTFIKY